MDTDPHDMLDKLCRISSSRHMTDKDMVCLGPIISA